MNVDAVFGGDFRGILGGDADDVLDFCLHLRRAGRGQVNLVDHRQHLQPGIHRQIGVCQSLCLHALAGIHHQHSALTGGERAGNLIIEVHMTRGVNQVQVIFFAVVGGVVQLNSGGLDGDAPLPFQLHGIQQLLRLLAQVNGLALLHKPVCQGGLAMVNVGNDGKISDVG